MKDPINLIIIGIRHFQRQFGLVAGTFDCIKAQRKLSVPLCFSGLLFLLLLTGCSSHRVHVIETTAYCGCGLCCSWERGSWKFLKLDFWNRYVNAGRRQGQPYNGKTAWGVTPVEPQPGLFSADSLTHPWMIPFRAVFPWLWFHHDGTIAADTDYYPFGTQMYIPGWGWGLVTDRGGAIKGPDRIDLFFSSHAAALQWGRRRLPVEIIPP